MKKILSLFALVLMSCMGAWAQSGGFFRLHHANPDANWYISVNAAGNDYAKSESTKTDGSDVWQFIPTGVDGQYYIFNPYSGRYIGRTGDVGNNTAIPLVTSVYKAGHYSKENAQFDSYNGFYLRDNTNSNNDRNGLHSTSEVTFVRWQSQSNCGNSVWLLDNVDFSIFQTQEFPSSWNNKDGDNQTSWTNLNTSSTKTILNASAPIYKDVEGFVVTGDGNQNTSYVVQWAQGGGKRYDIFGIELIQNDEVKYVDYHYEIAGSSDDFNGSINGVAPGTYTIRVWSSRKCTDGATVDSNCKVTPKVNNVAGNVTQWGVNDWTNATIDALSYGLKCIYFDKPGTFRPSGYGYFQQQICSEQAGTVALLFDHESGSNRLDIQGVELLTANGNSIVSHDIHEGSTGDSDSKNVYVFNVPIAKMPYIVRIWTNGTRNSKGTISVVQTYTIETDSESLSDITNELGTTPSAIVVKSGATFNVDAEYDMSKVSFENGSAVIISNASADLSAIKGNVDVTINVNEYSFENSKCSQATGKLTINSGKKLKVGSDQAHTGSVSSFTSLLIQGTLWYQNKSDILHNVTLDGGTIHSEDMDAPGSNASGFNFSNALVFEGVTTVRNTVYFTSRWNAQYDIKKLDGNGTVRICGNGTSSSESVEDTYYAIRNVEDFTGNFNFTNTKAIVSSLAGVCVVNNAKVKSVTLSNITISGNTRVEAAGNLTVNGSVTNNLSNNQYGYAFVGNGSGATINLGGTIDLTQANGVTNANDKIGYGSGMTVNILTGADILVGGVYNSTTLTSNANVNIASNATLAVKDKTLTPSLTNNGTIKLLDLNTTRYTATTVSGDAFNVEVSNDLLSNMSAESYNVVTGVTTNNVANYTLNGQSEIVIGDDHFRVMYNESTQNIVLTKQQIIEYTVTYRTPNNHSWQVEGSGIANTTLNINNFNVEFYTNFAFEGDDLQLREDNKAFTIACEDNFPFTPGEPRRLQTKRDVSVGGDFYVHTDGNAYAKAGVTSYEDNKNVWVIEHAAGTPDIFTVRSFYNNKYLTLTQTLTAAQASMEASPVGTSVAPFNSESTSYFRVKRSTHAETLDGFCLTHPKREQMCMAIHHEPSNWETIGYGVGGWGNGDVDRKDNALFVFPIESFTSNLAATDGVDHYGSIYLPYTMTLPEGVEAYAAVKEDEVLKLTKVGEVGAVIPAGAYILYSASETSATLALGATAPVPAGSNALAGRFVANVDLPDGNNYVLNDKNGVVGFYKYTKTTYPVAKAVFCAGTTASSASFAFRFEDVVTAIDALHSNNSNAEIFDLQGRRLTKAQQGMNIINGHKVLVK